MNLLSLDIETKCNQNCVKVCDHALFPQFSDITLIGVWCPDFEAVFTVQEFIRFLKDNPTFKFLGHNLKWDLKQLSAHGVTIPVSKWAHDTQLLAHCITRKIDEEWLEKYAAKRKQLNAELPDGYSHREGSLHSLKTLAPYFLNVPPFWEDPTDHAKRDYVLKDAQYTYRLFDCLSKIAKEEGTFAFYEKKLLPWTKTLFKAEKRGVLLSGIKLKRWEILAAEKEKRFKADLDSQWKDAYSVWRNLLINDVEADYKQKEQIALNKLKNPTEEKLLAVTKRYHKLLQDRLKSLELDFNLGSNSQVLWLLRDYFKLDTSVRVRDKETNIVTDKNSTGVEVLNRLADSRKDIQTLLQYRKYNKLSTAFFPSYRELMVDGVIHASFNPTGTRTGRLSSSNPNLQQVAGGIKSIFTARPGYKLACFDESGIEARLMAYFSEDPILCDIVINDKDIHGFHAIIFFGLDCAPEDVKKLYPEERKLAKNVGFGLFYGAGYRRIQQEAMKKGYKWSDEHCRSLYNRFKETYSTVFEYKRTIDKMAEYEAMSNLFGRKYILSDEDIYMKNFNTLVQSSASDLVLESARRTQAIFERLNIDAHFLITVHDELVFEVPSTKVDICVKIIKKAMTKYILQTAYGKIPLKVEGNVSLFWSK